MIKILTLFGTRPEAIKMAMLVKSLDSNSEINHRLCITSQHREMLDQVLDFFNIVPYYDLNLMRPGQNLTDITCRILTSLGPVFNDFKPDLVLVHGDTTTCFVGSLAAFYHQVPVGHVEAGLRTGNLNSPFPEEINRKLTGQIANLHFAPTPRNVKNLLKEGINASNIILTGNTVIDSLHFASEKVHEFSSHVKNESVRSIFKGNKPILLITGHRRENFGKGFIEICEAISTIATCYPDLQLVYPVHLNPNVQKPVFQRLDNISNIHLIEPLSYPDFIFAMKKAWAILTDSGGVQEEAPSLGKPVLVMRDTTERPEAVEAGTVRLVGANRIKIVEGVSELMRSRQLYETMSTAVNPYGDGKAVSRIVEKILTNINIF